MASQEPLKCYKCGITFKSGNALEEHERHCQENGGQKKVQKETVEDKDGVKYVTHETRNTPDEQKEVKVKNTIDYPDGRQEVITHTATDTNGVKEVRQTMESHDGKNDVKKETTSRSGSKNDGGSSHSKDYQRTVYEAGSGAKKDEKVSDSETDLADMNNSPFPDGGQSSKMPKEKNQDIGKTPYPTEKTKKDSTGSVPEEKDPVDDFVARLPEASRETEKAFESHQKSLIPCTHCERTFSPERLPQHEKACISRPKGRDYATPKKEDPKGKEEE